MDNLDNNNFKFRFTEWRGYVVRVIEDIDKHIVENNKRLDRIEKRLNHAQIKIASIGGGVAIIFSLLFRFLLK